MMFAVTCTIQASLILMIALLAVHLFRRRSAALRHRILSAGIFCVAILPAATRIVPSWGPSRAIVEVAAVRGGLYESSVNPLPSTLSQQRPFISKQTLAIVWLGGVCLGLVVLIVGLTRLARVAFLSEPIRAGTWARLAERISQQYGLRRRVRLLESCNPAMLVTWGMLRPKILLPAGSRDWPEDRVRAVLCHELAHIRRCDWFVQTAGEMLRALYWFNPLIWVVCSRLRLESEYAADDAVLAQGVTGPGYAGHLLDVVRVLQQTERPWSATLAMARPSTVERRFTAMLNPDLNRRPVGRLTMFMIVAAALGVTLPLAAVSKSAPAPTSSSELPRVPSTIAPVANPPVEAARPAIPRPARVLAAAPQVEKHYTGEITSFDFKDLDIKDFFRLIANFSGLNIVLEPGINETVTMTLIDVPWDQALDIVLRDHQLTSRLEGQVIHISRTPLAAKEPIKLGFEIYRNGLLIASPAITTTDGVRASLQQNQFSLSVLATRLAAGMVEVNIQVAGSGGEATTNIDISEGKPAVVSWKSDSGETMVLRIAELPNN